MAKEIEDSKSAEPKGKKLPWWKRGLKLLGGVVGQVATGVVGLACAIGAVASLVAAFAALPASLAFLGYTALYTGCAYGCKKGFEKAGEMTKEGWTGKSPDGSRASSGGESRGGPGKGVEVSREKLEQDGIIKSGLKVVAGGVGAVVSVTGALVGKAFEWAYNKLFDKKTNAISSMFMGALDKSLDLAKHGLNRGRNIEMIQEPRITNEINKVPDVSNNGQKIANTIANSMETTFKSQIPNNQIVPKVLKTGDNGKTP